MTAHDAPADTGDVEALAEVVGRVLSEYLDDAAPLNERHYVAAVRHVLNVDGSPGMTAYFAARDAAQRADEAERIAQAIEALPCPGSPPAPLARYAFETAKEHAAAIARAGTAGGSDA